MGFLQELDRVLTKAQHSKFLAPDSYSLEKAPARSLDDLHNISTLLVVLIADKRAQLPENEKNKLLDDLNRYMLEAIREFNPVSVSIPLFRIID